MQSPQNHFRYMLVWLSYWLPQL